jgi:kynurenine formamidase
MSSGQVPESTIRGYASIDYRLSPHPSFPQDPNSTPASEFRGARHPDHIQDIRSALAFLQEHYQLSSDYVLVGHSAGATLAYQLLMGQDALSGEQAPEVPLPAAIVAISGIYDIVALVRRFGGPYKEFVSSAFGDDAAVWEKASPASYAGDFKNNWSNGAYNIIAWSPEDQLIDEAEIDAMAAKLTRDGVVVTIRKDLTGDHDVVWETGSQVSHLIILALAKLQ